MRYNVLLNEFFHLSQTLLLLNVTYLAITSSSSEPIPSPDWRTLHNTATQIIGHRGDAFYMPAHTIESYSVAVEEGADWVEPDLVMVRASKQCNEIDEIEDKVQGVNRKHLLFLCCRRAKMVYSSVRTISV